MASNPQLTQMIDLQMTGTQQIVGAIQGVTQAFEKYAKSQDKTAKKQKQTKDSMKKLSDQGIANIQAGLVQLSTYLLNMNVKINNVFANMTKRFTEAEDAMTQLRITMGLTNVEARMAGNDTGLGALQKDYERFEGVIDSVAATTEYSKKQVANAFTSLIQSGRSAEEALTMLRPVLQMTTASAGQLGLAEAIDIATLTIGTLGGEVKDVRGNLNMLLRTTQKTKIGFKDLQHTLGSLRAGFTKFAKPMKESGETRESQLMALASIVRETGLGHAEAGQKVDQFAKAISGLGTALMKNELRSFLGKGGKGRFSQKRSALLMLFGIDPNANYVDQMKALFKKNSITQDEALDLMLQSKLGKVDKETGKVERLSLGGTLDILTKQYASLVASKGKKKADDLVKSAMGQDAAVFVLQAIADKSTKVLKEVDKEGKNVFYTAAEAGTVFRNVSKELAKDARDLENAEKEAMNTLSYKMKVLEGAQDALSNSIFKHDAYAQSGVETYKEMVSATTTLMNNNEGLATSIGFMGRMMQLLTGFGTNMGFMLVASATFSMGLKHAQDITGKSTKSLGGTLKAFSTAFLNPTMLVVRQLAGGFFFLGLMIVATMRYVSGAEKGIGAGFRDVLSTVTNAAKALGGFINLAFHKDMQNKSVRKLVSDYQDLKKQYQDTTAKMRILEAQGVDPTSKSMTVLQTKLDGISERMRKTSDVLGESAVDGLAKIGHLGGGALVQSLAGVIDVLRALGRAAVTLFEAAIVPLMYSLQSIFFVLGQALKVPLTVIRIFAKLFGFTANEASILSEIIKGLGYFLGTAFGGFVVIKSIQLFIFGLKSLRGFFVSLGGSVMNYNRNVRNTTQILSNSNAVDQAKMGRIEKLTLRYYSLTGQVDKFRQSVILSNNARTNGLVNIGERLKSVGSKAMTAGFLVSMLMTSFGGEGMQQFGNYLGLVITIIPTFITAIMGISAAWKAAGLSAWGAAKAFLAAFWPILAVLAAGYGLYKLFTYFSDDKKSPSSSTPTTTAKAASAAKVLPDKSTPSAVASAMSSAQGVPTGDFGGSGITPMSSSMASKGATTDFGGGSGGYIPSPAPQKNITINQKINVKAIDSEKSAKEIAKQTKRTLESADSLAFGQ